MDSKSEVTADRCRPADDSIERALAIVGDRWSFLLLREAFFGVRRFDGFLAALQIAPNILTGRLKRLVEGGLLERRPYCERPPRFEYRLTDMGRDLYPTIVSFMNWGDRWLSQGVPPLALRHRLCGHRFATAVVCDQCGRPIAAHDVDWEATDA